VFFGVVKYSKVQTQRRLRNFLMVLWGLPICSSCAMLDVASGQLHVLLRFVKDNVSMCRSVQFLACSCSCSAVRNFVEFLRELGCTL